MELKKLDKAWGVGDRLLGRSHRAIPLASVTVPEHDNPRGGPFFFIRVSVVRQGQKASTPSLELALCISTTQAFCIILSSSIFSCRRKHHGRDYRQGEA